MKKLAVITAVPEELNDSISAFDYSIGPILESKLFDEVILAVPDKVESAPLRILAERHGIIFFAGDPNNVCQRFQQLLNCHTADIISRFQLRASWVDMDLVRRSLELVASGYDYADYAYDVNYAMGCDTFSLAAFKRVVRCLAEINEDEQRKRTFEFSPWAYMQDPSCFNVGQIEAPSMYSPAKALAIRDRLNILIGDKQNMIGSPVDQPALRYVKVAGMLNRAWNIGEISCGYGGGAAYLSKYCKHVTAYEINSSYIDYARTHYSKYSVNYILGDDRYLAQAAESYDCIVSLHTLEHVSDDWSFLAHINEALRPGA